MRKIFCIIMLSVCFIFNIDAQKISKEDFLNQCDLSSIWSAGIIMGNFEIIDDEIDTLANPLPRPESIGFIGNDYQRFYIHFTSVQKEKKNSTQYLIKGKTKVRNNICDFSGSMDIISVTWLNQEDNYSDINIIQQGIISGRYLFFEDEQQPGTGKLQGSFMTNIYIDYNKNEVHYDALYFYGDGYCNNMFQGTWKSYRTSTTKICNWGDFRIPQSGDLDIGAGEFSPAPEYYPKGWEIYAKQFYDTPDGEKARQAEQQEWWK